MGSATTKSELEAAIAALSFKKGALRDSFHRLAAGSPFPLPFTWDYFDDRISSLQNSIAARFRHFQSLQAASAANDPVVHHCVSVEGIREGSEEDERVEGAIVALPDVEDGEVEVVQASPNHELKEKNENVEEGVKLSEDYQRNGETQQQANRLVPNFTGGRGGSGSEAAATPRRRRDPVASTGMDASTLADLLCWGSNSCLRARRLFLPAVLGAAEPHALVVRAVTDFLHRTEPKSACFWENCVALLNCVRRLTTEPSGDTREQANRLAEDWKGMIGKPECCRNLGRLASWGLFSFLASYNIVLEFDAHDIIRIFGDISGNKRQNCIELCKDLGLVDKMNDSINHLIENGKQLDAVKLACALDLRDKYSPLSIMNEYIDKAKKTAQEILSKESDSQESLNQAMKKEVNALILSWRSVDECNIDSVHRDNIKAEVTQLLHEYANKRQNILDASSSALSPHQQQHMLQEQNQQQQQIAKERRHQQMGQRKHQQELRNQQAEQEWTRQNFREKRRNKKRNRKLRTQQQRWAQGASQDRFHKQARLYHAGSFAYSPYNIGPGIRDHRKRQFSEIL